MTRLYVMLEYVTQMVNLLGLKWPGGPFNGDTTTIRCGGYIDKIIMPLEILG